MADRHRKREYHQRQPIKYINSNRLSDSDYIITTVKENINGMLFTRCDQQTYVEKDR